MTSVYNFYMKISPNYVLPICPRRLISNGYWVCRHICFEGLNFIYFRRIIGDNVKQMLKFAWIQVVLFKLQIQTK